MKFKAGDLIEVRSKEEILATLDKNGRLDGMPFMPQMLQYCGRRFVVSKSAHKTCDPIYTMKSRSVGDAVHLNLRCDGKAFGGCQAGCLLFWKDAWLKSVNGDDSATAAKDARLPGAGHAGCTEAHIDRAARNGPNAAPGTRYVCQTTELMNFTRPLPWWQPKQYFDDLKSGNVGLSAVLQGALYVMLGRRGRAKVPLIGRIHDRIQLLIGDPAFGRTKSVPAPRASNEPPPLDLKPGELVRIKPHSQILATLDAGSRNRGLYFDVEMIPFCGKEFRVRCRVERFIDEKTGIMRSLKTPAVILEKVWCTSRFSTCRMHCPRQIYSWWRESWLERIEAPAIEATGTVEEAKQPAAAVVLSS